MCIAKSKIKIRRFIKYGPFQFTAVCSHTQLAVPPFLGSEVTFEGNSSLNRLSRLTSNIDIGTKGDIKTKGIYRAD